MNQTNSRPPRRILRRLVRVALGLLVILVLGAAARSYFAFRDRLPGYSLVVNLSDRAARAEPRPLRVGFTRAKINPDLSDPQRPVYLAGFGQNRRASSIHDDLWAIACVVDDGYARLGIVALDAIGIFHDDVVRVRQRLSKDLRLDYIVVCSTHNHSMPDLLGLWGPNPLRSGVDALCPRRNGTSSYPTSVGSITRLMAKSIPVVLMRRDASTSHWRNFVGPQNRRI